MLYFDHNATTPVDPAVIEAMLPYFYEHWGNPSSGYDFAKPLVEAIDRARGQVASLIGAGEGEVVFTGGGTEADNAAIASALELQPERPCLLVAESEHSAVFESATVFAGAERVITIPLAGDGRLDFDAYQRILASKGGEIALVSVMWANNETGVIQDMERIVTMAHEYGIAVHSDAIQAAGKIPVDVRKVPLQYLSLAGHKFHAPKGVGALFVNQRTRFSPFIVGGGQEKGRRGGTENVAGIIAMGVAAEIAQQALEAGAMERVRALRDHFEQELMKRLDGVVRNGPADGRLPNTSHLRFSGVEAAAMLVLLDARGLCCSSGSACQTGSAKTSRVLKAMGLSDREAKECLRFSFSRMTTDEEIEQGLDIIEECVRRLRDRRMAVV